MNGGYMTQTEFIRESLGPNWTVEMQTNALDLSYDFYFGNKFNIERDKLVDGIVAPHIQLLKKVEEIICATVVYKNNVSDYKLEISRLELKLEEAKKELEYLRPFQQHFEVEMKLRHGEK